MFSILVSVVNAVHAVCDLGPLLCDKTVQQCAIYDEKQEGVSVFFHGDQYFATDNMFFKIFPPGAPCFVCIASYQWCLGPPSIMGFGIYRCHSGKLNWPAAGKPMPPC